MLTIYNRNKQVIGVLQTAGSSIEAYNVTLFKRANSEYKLTFLIPMNSKKYSLIQKEGLIECEGQKYVIKNVRRNREGKARTVEVTANHVFNRMMDISVPYASQIDERLGTDISYLTNLITNATNGAFTFQIMDTFPVKDVYKWGTTNCLKAFQDLATLYSVEFIPDNYIIKLYNKVMVNKGLQYRIDKNIISDSYETSTEALVTRMTGLAKDSLTIIGLPTTHLKAEEFSLLNAVPNAIVDGVLKVPYLISQYASSWATPDNVFFDGSFEDTGIDADTEAGKVKLLEEIRKRLAKTEVPDIQVKINPADLWKTNKREVRPELWETVFCLDEGMELGGLEAKIVELREYPFDFTKHAEVTIANYILKDDFDIITELNTSKKDLESLLSNKKVNTSYFEQFAKDAVNDINKSKSEIIYDQRGQILQSKSNPLHQIVMASDGIYITTDGGLTAPVALTAKGIAAEVITGILGEFVTVRANQIILGGNNEKIADGLLHGAEGWNAKETPEGAEEKAKAAQQAAEAVAVAKAELAKSQAEAYADGIVTAEEQARIDQDEATLNAAKLDATNKANAAETAAKDASVQKGVKYDNSITLVDGRGIVVSDEKDLDRVIAGQWEPGKYGLVGIHTDGSKTILDGTGLSRLKNGVAKPYNYLSDVGSSETGTLFGKYFSAGSSFASDGNLNDIGAVMVKLPEDFKGKNFKVALSYKGGDPFRYAGLAGAPFYKPDFAGGIFLKVINYDYPQGSCIIQGYQWYYVLDSFGAGYKKYHAIEFSYTAVA